MARNPRALVFRDGMEKRATENLGLEGVVFVKILYEVVLLRDGLVLGIIVIFLYKFIFGPFSSEIGRVYISRKGNTWT